MKPVHWIIQENGRSPGTVQGLVDALLNDGHVPHLIILEKGAGVPTINGLPDDAALVCSGPGFVTRALNHPRLRQGLYFDPALFRWSEMQRAWGHAMLARDGHVSTIPNILAQLSSGQKVFVRPDEDSKAFDGAVYDADGLRSATEKWRGKGASPVIVATPVQIDAEWRLFVVSGKIVACSQYRQWGRPSIDGPVPHSAIELGIELAAVWSPASVFCLDLGLSQGRIGVIEANCFNASRFYGADVTRILQAVNELATEQQTVVRTEEL